MLYHKCILDHVWTHLWRVAVRPGLLLLLQGYLAHEKHPPPRTLQKDYLGSYGGPRGGGLFLMSEVPLPEKPPLRGPYSKTL